MERAFQAQIETPDSPSRFVVVCEHASNFFPEPWGNLGLTPEQQVAHIAWDPGALPVARALARLLDAPLVHAPVSRLIYDLNRPPIAASAMPARSEVHDIPGNSAIDATERLNRTRAVYVPFHQDLGRLIAERLAGGIAPVLVTMHTFTPIYHGQPRAVEVGLIHDSDPDFTHCVAEAAQGQSHYQVQVNEPYSAQDGVTHMLAMHATPYGLPHVMVEIRNDLVATADTQKQAAEWLASALTAALGLYDSRKGHDACPSS